MELLRRALLVGGLLTAAWLWWLAPLDPLVTIVPVDFALIQKQEAAAVPDSQKTDAQRRRAEMPLPVYMAESIEFNVFPAAGSEWDAFLRAVDERIKQHGPAGAGYLDPEKAPLPVIADKLAAGGGATYVSFTRPNADGYYRVVRHRWTRADFRMWTGLIADPPPAASLLYPFRLVGLAVGLGGVLLFVLLPGARADAMRRVSAWQFAALGLGSIAFALPLFAMGGSAQALSQGLRLTAPCWIAAAIGLHFFAAPARTAPDPLVSAVRVPLNIRFVREGLAFLLMALGPLAFLVWGTMILWNR